MAALAKAPTTHEEIERQIQQIQAQRSNLPKADIGEKVGLASLGEGGYDVDIYGSGGNRFEGYSTDIAPNEQEEDEDDYSTTIMHPSRNSYTAPAAVLNEIVHSAEHVDPFAQHRQPTIAEREDDYRARRRKMIISPPRNDPFADVCIMFFKETDNTFDGLTMSDQEDCSDSNIINEDYEEEEGGIDIL